MNDEDFLLKLCEAFAIEAEEHLEAMSAALLDLEKTVEPARREKILETIFREAHSLKGASRAVNRTDIEAVCQALESVFAIWKREGASVSAETFDVLNGALDFVGKLRGQSGVAASAAERTAVQEMVRQVMHLAERAAARPKAKPAPAAPAAPAPASVAPSHEPAPPPAEPPASVPEAPFHETEHLSLAETVRVPMAKMDALLLQAEEMVSVKLVAAQQVAELRALGVTLETWCKEWTKVSGLTTAPTLDQPSGGGGKLREFLEWNESQIDALARTIAALVKTSERDERIVAALVDGLLAGAKQLVMLPCARLFDLFPKQVRDQSREQGKEIELSIRGREVEIDKRILEEMKAPLIHLLRNAIDHGIEKPETRAAHGKTPRGLLTIAAAQRDGNKVEILVADDGDGIDVEKVKASALKAGVVSASEAGALAEAQALALIFQSGISTSPILTEISGRGLGMAIVREKIEKLGGQIAIETTPGKGTAFRMLLPVTLATFKGILVTAGGQTFVIPTASVEAITRKRRDEIKTVENRETICYESRAVALTWLAEVLERPRREPQGVRSFVEVLILGTAEQRMAFAVESVLNEQEVLVKKLGKPLVRVRNIAGATMLGSGAPVLILNVVDLLESAVRLAGSGRIQAASGAGEEERVRRILVADDSVTSRMLLKNILETAGYQVTTAFNGVDAFATLRSGEYDVVVSDVEMPRMDGFELTEKIRADKKYAELPVVLVTALSSREHHERGVDVGANAYIVKSSFDQSNLLEVIRRLI